MASSDRNQVSRPFHGLLQSLCTEYDSLQLAHDELYKRTLYLESQINTDSPNLIPYTPVVPPEPHDSHEEVQVMTGALDAKCDCEEGAVVSQTPNSKDDEPKEVDLDINKDRAKKITAKLRGGSKGGAIGQFIQATVNGEKTSTKLSSCRELVKHPVFESVFAILIFANTVVMCFEVQYRGFDIGYNMDHPTTPNPSATAWPQANLWIDYLMFFFGLAFTIEVVLKVYGLRLEFVKTVWNWFDTLVVSAWVLEQIGLADLILNPNLFRALRLVRLVRLTRMISIVEGLDSLQVLIGSMKACGPVLLWAAAVLIVITIITGLFLNGFLEHYMTSNSELPSDKQQIYKYFGSFTRVMVTMYEITLGNWVPVVRLLMEDVNQVYGPLLLIYRFVIGFSMVKVIAGVFLHETFKVAATDDNLMVLQKQRQTSKMKKKMAEFMRRTDLSGDQKIQRDEFMKILEDKWIRTWLSSMDLEPADADLLFELTDDGDGEVTAKELFDGFGRLKGAARSIDLIGLTYRFSSLEELVEEVCTSLTAQGPEVRKGYTKVEASSRGKISTL